MKKDSNRATLVMYTDAETKAAVEALSTQLHMSNSGLLQLALDEFLNRVGNGSPAIRGTANTESLVRNARSTAALIGH